MPYSYACRRCFKFINYIIESGEYFEMPLNVQEPNSSRVAGYDVVSFSGHVGCECSPLSCNYLAESVPVNRHCLLDSYERAAHMIENGQLDDCEPGPYRIVEVHLITAPNERMQTAFAEPGSPQPMTRGVVKHLENHIA